MKIDEGISFQMLNEEIVTGYRDILHEAEIREQNKKTKDIDLVTVISPISCHRWHV